MAFIAIRDPGIKVVLMITFAFVVRSIAAIIHISVVGIALCLALIRIRPNTVSTVIMAY